MLKLAILRHAKSSWDAPGLDDFSRPLAPRGLAAAPQMGTEIRRLGISPRVILCSAALRTRETLRLAMPDAEKSGATVLIEDGLYMASAEMLMGRLRRLPDATSPVLMIGHNPSLQILTLALAGSGPPGDLADLSANFPTCALAVLTFDMPSWTDLSVRSGRLVHYTTPRRLSETG